MRLLFALLVGFSLSLGVSSGALAQPAGIAPGPRIQFDENVFDFGEIYQDTDHTHAFGFANVGDAPLTVKRTQTSCGCTAAIASEGPIAPGGRGEIRVTYSSKRSVGAQSKTVTVFSNAPDSVTTITVKAKVKAEVMFPSTVSFGKVPREAPQEQTFEVSAEKGLAFEVVKVETDSPQFQASFKKGAAQGTNAGQSYSVTVKMLPKAPVGALNSRIKVYTNLEKKPILEIPIIAYVQGDLKIQPEAVNFGTFKPGAAEEVVLTVEAPPSHPIKITSVTSTSPEVIAKLTTLKEGQSYEVRCSVAPTKQSGRISGKLIIETSDPEEGKRELPLIGFLKS
jgi:hypothetical protein